MTFTPARWLPFLFLGLSLGTPHAQERFRTLDTQSADPIRPEASLQLAPVPQHTHKPFVDSKGDIYWPQDKAVWIWLGTSPDNNEDNLLLKGMPGSTPEESERYRTQGIRLEITGNQYVRWLHYFTKEETLYRFFSDGVPPTVQLDVEGKNRYESGGRSYFAQRIQTSLQASDEGSSVEQVFQSINGQPFTAASNLNLTKEGRYHLRYYALDRVGWVSDVGISDLILDQTPPVSEPEVGGVTSSGFVGPQTTLIIRSDDELSGVQRTWYQWNEEPLREVALNSSVNFTGLEEGNHTFRFQAEDRVGNLEPLQEVQYFLDSTGPEASHAIEGDFYEEGSRSYVSARSKIRLMAEDAHVDIQRITYRINGLSYGDYNEPFLIPASEGAFRLEYEAEDTLNNRSLIQRADFILDGTPPETTLQAIGPSYRRGMNALWVRSDTSIQLKSQDRLSGVREIGYDLGQGNFQPYNEPINIDEEGRYTFQYRAVDQVGNEEVPTPVLLIVDNTPPSIQERFSIAPVRTYQVSGEQVQAYPPYTVLFLSALDDSANLKEVRYRNGTQMVPYKQALTLQKPGAYELEIEAEDNVGNLASKTIRFIIESGE